MSDPWHNEESERAREAYEQRQNEKIAEIEDRVLRLQKALKIIQRTDGKMRRKPNDTQEYYARMVGRTKRLR